MALPPRQFDVAVLGVTGFTGQFVLKELVSQIRDGFSKSRPPGTGLQYPVRVAAAGRNVARVRKKLAELGIAEESSSTGKAGDPGDKSTQTVTGREGVGVTVGVAEVDVLDDSSVAELCRSTRLILDCVGPFRFYGEPVVSGCVEANTDYVDVSGEPEFMERMLYKYGEKASLSNALIVSACGFDSIPAELGVQATVKALGTGGSPPGVAHARVDSFLSVHAPLGSRGHYGTWDSLVNGIASVNDLRKLRQSQRKKTSARKEKPKGSSKGKMGVMSMLPQWNPTVKSWVLPFPGADVSVVRRSLAHAQAQAQALAASTSAGDAATLAAQAGSDRLSEAGEPLLQSKGEGGSGVSSALMPASSFMSVHYSAYFTVRSAIEGYLFVVFGVLLTLMVRWEATKKLLLQYPEFFSLGLFSRTGPTPQQMEATSITMRFIGERTDSGTTQGRDRVRLTVQGPEPGYVLTPWVMVQCGLIILSERGTLPKGGVLTPAVAFAGTDLQQRLEERGMKFEVEGEGE